MAIVIPVINLKGGVAKTTTSVGLAEMLSSEFKKKVLFIDLDPQTNGTTMLIGEHRWKDLNDNGYTLARLFESALHPEEFTFDLNRTLQRNVSNILSVMNLDLIPSSLDLINLQDDLTRIPRGRFYTNHPYDILRKGIQPIFNHYDYIIIDCPPNLGLITLNGLRIANGYIIPTIPDVLSTYGIPQIINRVNDFAWEISYPIETLGIVITKFKENSNVHQTNRAKLQREIDAPLFNAVFKENNQMASAADFTMEYATFRQKWGYGGQFDAFYNLANEIVERYERNEN
ncbi:ParA family protein [Ureibacillus acetophenoni]|uniref:Chromosome partitioning protein n=1 Tax=Ureibacillus acetophenoni TaxID=614649 RepID=A0A285URF3_9BACL|nr:AAA family ATPase [Ureibacillus acetophenoni]SOC43246.1 chromosome partitioning protein [Ureibacillus acetophenoni]